MVTEIEPCTNLSAGTVDHGSFRLFLCHSRTTEWRGALYVLVRFFNELLLLNVGFIASYTSGNYRFELIKVVKRCKTVDLIVMRIGCQLYKVNQFWLILGSSLHNLYPICFRSLFSRQSWGFSLFSPGVDDDLAQVDGRKCLLAVGRFWLYSTCSSNSCMIIRPLNIDGSCISPTDDERDGSNAWAFWMDASTINVTMVFSTYRSRLFVAILNLNWSNWSTPFIKNVMQLWQREHSPSYDGPPYLLCNDAIVQTQKPTWYHYFSGSLPRQWACQPDCCSRM